MEENAPRECCKLLVATKTDLTGERMVSSADAQKLALSIGVEYL